MKQISMDYDTYRRDLEAAKLEGLQLRRKTLEETQATISALYSYSTRETVEKAIHQFRVFLRELGEVKE